MELEYYRSYLEGVKSGMIRSGVKFKTVVTSAAGQPLTYRTVYEDQEGYAAAEFVLPF